MKIKTLLLIFTLSLVVNVFGLYAQEPLPSWNEGPAKKSIIEYVQRTASLNDKDFIPVEERIVTFDQDGTLWAEKPYYAQLAFAISQVKTLAAAHPEWKSQSPYQAILESDQEKIQQFTLQDIEKIVAATHADMTTVEFEKNVQEWLKTAKHPRYNKLYTELTYQPMLELIGYLKKYQYKVYIVSGGGQDFIRAYSFQTYGIPPEQIVGSTGKTKYENKADQPVLVKQPTILFVDDKAGKPEAIHLFIGKKPVFAAGNSDGDREMLEWSQASERKSFQLLVHHDDPIREYAYDAHSKIGTFSDSLKEEAIKNKWLIVSMKNDWKKIFSFE